VRLGCGDWIVLVKIGHQGESEGEERKLRNVWDVDQLQTPRLTALEITRVAQWLALLLHSTRDLGSIPGWVTVCVESAHSPRVCVGFLRVLWFPPTVQKCAG